MSGIQHRVPRRTLTASYGSGLSQCPSRDAAWPIRLFCVHGPAGDSSRATTPDCRMFPRRRSSARPEDGCARGAPQPARVDDTLDTSLPDPSIGTRSDFVPQGCDPTKRRGRSAATSRSTAGHGPAAERWRSTRRLRAHARPGGFLLRLMSALLRCAARCVLPHRVEFVSRCPTRRSHRPRHPNACSMLRRFGPPHAGHFRLRVGREDRSRQRRQLTCLRRVGPERVGELSFGA